jgi:hypothetical protein
VDVLPLLGSAPVGVTTLQQSVFRFVLGIGPLHDDPGRSPSSPPGFRLSCGSFLTTGRIGCSEPRSRERTKG